MAKQKETSIWKKALISLSKAGYRLFRNQRYKGQIVRKGLVTDAWADCGLCDGAGDLIGYKILIVTPEMVGTKIAQFATIETKIKEGTVSDDQKTFMDCVQRDGGYVAVIRTENALDEIFRAESHHPA